MTYQDIKLLQLVQLHKFGIGILSTTNLFDRGHIEVFEGCIIKLIIT
jgi:hypothetical protein